MIYKRVKFTIRTPNGTHDLLTAEQRPNGDIGIYLDHKTSYIDERGQHFEKNYHRYSIHPSPNSHGNLIKQQLSLKDGRTLSGTAFVGHTADKLLWPLFIHRPPTFSPSEPIPAGGERIVNIAKYDPHISTLVYFLAAFRPTFIDKNALSGFRIFTHSFPTAGLALGVCFMAGPTLPDGNYIHFCTSPPTDEVTKMPLYAGSQIETDSMSATEFKAAILNSLLAQQDDLVRRAETACGPDAAKMARQLASIVSGVPLTAEMIAKALMANIALPFE
jgi:hypothetical protein